MRFSLILPIYNVEDYLEDCLLSILNQSFKDFECLLIDDGSTDYSSKICEKFIEEDSKFKYFYKKNGGLSDARNFGLDRAVGEYIVFIDSDDLISTNALFEVNSCILKHMSDIVYFDYKKFHAAKDEPCPQFDLSVSANSARKISNVILTKKPNFAWARVAKRELYINNRFPVGFIYEDVLTSPLLSARAKVVSHIKHELYGYRKRPNSITTGSAEKQFQLFETLKLLKENVIREKIDTKFYTTAFVNLIQSCLVSLVRIENRKIRQKYMDIILAEYNKLSYREVLNSWSYNKYKILTLLSKNKISLLLLSAALRKIVLMSDKKGKE